MDELKTDANLVSGVNCTPEFAQEEFEYVKKKFNKADGLIAHHVLQNFKPGEVSNELAHKLGVELVQKIAPDHQALVITHVDKAHIHNHIIINSVNQKTGKKYNADKTQYWFIRKESDKLCKENNLSIVEPKGKGNSIDKTTYYFADRGQSWKAIMANTIKEALEECKTKNEFINYMQDMGYEVKWQNKNISFTAPEQERAVRAETLAKNFGKQFSMQSICKKFNVDYIRNDKENFERGDDWKEKLVVTIDRAVEECKSKEEFISYMQIEGYKVNWQNKNISFSKLNSNKKPIRAKRLSEMFGEKYSKEAIENRLGGTFKEKQNENGPYTRENRKYGTDVDRNTEKPAEFRYENTRYRKEDGAKQEARGSNQVSGSKLLREMAKIGDERKNDETTLEEDLRNIKIIMAALINSNSRNKKKEINRVRDMKEFERLKKEKERLQKDLDELRKSKNQVDKKLER
jgi:nicotinamidase-related amidase